MNVTCCLAAVMTSVAPRAQAESPQADNPEARVIAVVLGKNITLKDKGRLNGLIVGALLEQYAREHRIETTDEELDTFAKKMGEREKEQQKQLERDLEALKKELESPSLDAQERKEKETRLQTLERSMKLSRLMRGSEDTMRQMRRQMGQRVVKMWKINKSLYEKYGGRVIFQQAGAEPLDACRDFLREQENRGSFRILEKEFEAPFWKYYMDDRMHTFYPREEGEKHIHTQWWMIDPPAKE